MSASTASRLRELRADESATRVLDRAQHTVDRSSVMLLYGQRLALLGQVSSAMHVIVVEEERERKEISVQWEYEGWMRGVLANEGRVVAAAAAVGERNHGLQHRENEFVQTTHDLNTHPTTSDTRNYLSVANPPNADEHTPIVDQANHNIVAPSSSLAPSEALATTRRYKLSPSAMQILSDPATAEKILAAKRDRSLAQLLKKTRPAPDAVPKLHFMPPLRLANGIDRSFKAPILEALYGPTSAGDELLEGRPASTIKGADDEGSKKYGKGRSGYQLRSSTRQQSFASNSFAGKVTKSGVFTQHKSLRGSHNTVAISNSPAARGGLAPSTSTVFNSGSASKLSSHPEGLSAVLSHTFSPVPAHRHKAKNTPTHLSPFTNEPLEGALELQSPALGFVLHSPLLHKRKDSANIHGRSGHVTILADDSPPWTITSAQGGHSSHPTTAKATPLDRPMLSRVASSAFTAEEGCEDIGESDSSQSPLRSESSQSPIAHEQSKSSNTEGLNSPPEAELEVMNYEEPWYWAEQDSAIAVAVMACVVADGLDEVMVRETFEKQEAAERKQEGTTQIPDDQTKVLQALLEDEHQLNEDGSPNYGLLALTATDVSAVTEAILQHQPPPPAQKEFKPRVTSAGAKALTTADANVIEDAVALAKMSRGGGATSQQPSPTYSSPPTEEELQNQRVTMAALRAEWLKKAARAFRAATNKIEVEEHENRYELIHSEISAFKAIMHGHRTGLSVVRKTALSAQQHSKMILERRCTLELLKIVLLWQQQHDAMMHVYYGRRAVLQRVAAGRRELEAHEGTARLVIEEYALVLGKQLARQIQTEAETLRPVQEAYLKVLAVAEQREMERKRMEATRHERDLLIREHEEVQRRLQQKEALRKRREEQWATTGKLE